MITLTTPPQIQSVLGGSAPVGYDKLVISPFTYQPHPQNPVISATLKLTSTAQPSMPLITGSMNIDVTGATLEVIVERLDFYQKKTLTAGQQTSIRNQIDSAQNALESGLITLGVVAGTQSAGA